MNADSILGISGSVTQAELASLRYCGRLGEYAVVYRVPREQQSGGYGNQEKHPYAWAVAVYVDSQLLRIFAARGYGREWRSLERVSEWLRQQGFWYWWTRNDIEHVGAALPEQETMQSLFTLND
jgi:adenine-specific DNA methylase